MHTAPAPTRPSTIIPAPAGAALIDTGEMTVVHSMFRREVRLAGDLVRRVEPGDTRRSGMVARHLELVDRLLHHHHVTEDELLWPLLLARAPIDVSPIVDLMESQHHEVATLLARIEPHRAQWAYTADASYRDQLGVWYDQLAVALTGHLDDEESQRAAGRRCLPHPIRVGFARRRRATRPSAIGTDPGVRDDAARRRSPRGRHDARHRPEARAACSSPGSPAGRSASTPWPCTAPRLRSDRAARPQSRREAISASRRAPGRCRRRW